MKLAGVAGVDADRIGSALTERLADRGRVARVRAADAVADGGALVAGGTADTTYELADGRYTATGEAPALWSLVDDLTVDHDYAVLTGATDYRRLPHLVVGDADREGAVLACLDADEPDLDAAIEAIEESRPRETVGSLIRRAEASPGAARSGAIATFTGRVRERDDPGDAPTTHLEFELYEGVARERMDELEAELEDREGVYEVLLHHRSGVVEVGEDIVFVVVLAGHREEAFRTVSDGIDRLKEAVPIFKKEVTLDGEFWAHDRP